MLIRQNLWFPLLPAPIYNIWHIFIPAHIDFAAMHCSPLWVLMPLTPAHDMLSSLSILVLVLLRPQGPYGLLILWFSVLFSRGFGLPLMYQFSSLQSIIYFNIFSCIIGCLWPQCPYPLHYIALHFIYCPPFPFFFYKNPKHFVIIL